MAIITDPSYLVINPPGTTPDDATHTVQINYANKTIKLNPKATPGGAMTDGLSTDGVSGQALYSALKDFWDSETSTRKYAFPMDTITPTQFEFWKGWKLIDDASRKLMRNCGFAETNSTGTLREYAGITTLGALDSNDQPYYIQSEDGETINTTYKGAVNEVILIWAAIGQKIDPDTGASDEDGDELGEEFNKRSFFTIFAREYGKTYAQYTLAETGNTVMTYSTYAFLLGNADDGKITHNDETVGATDGSYKGIVITYYDDPVTVIIGNKTLNYKVKITGDSKTKELIYEKVQYLLRQNEDIDSDATGVAIGKKADGLLTFQGDMLICSPGVYIDGFDATDTNNITYQNTNEDGSVESMTYPFKGAIRISFNEHMLADPDAWFTVYFATGDGEIGDEFDSDGAIIVNSADVGSGDNTNGGFKQMTGKLSELLGEGVDNVVYTYDYDGNNQRGEDLVGTDAPIVIAYGGKTRAKNNNMSGTIVKSTTNAAVVTAERERSYNNP